jgi:hypothetical protein
MPETLISLTTAECELLHSMSLQTGKTENELLHEALDLLKMRVTSENRRSLLQKGRGIWKDREDLPALSELRSEMNRE